MTATTHHLHPKDLSSTRLPFGQGANPHVGSPFQVTIEILNSAHYPLIRTPKSFFKKLGRWWPEVRAEPHFLIEEKDGSPGCFLLRWFPSVGVPGGLTLHANAYIAHRSQEAWKHDDELIMAPEIFGRKAGRKKASKKEALA